MDRRQKTARCDETPLDEVAPADLALRMCFHHLQAVPAGVLRLANPGFGSIFRKEKSIFSIIHSGCSPSLAELVCLNGPAAIFSPSACLFITHPEGSAKSVSQQLGWG